MSCPRCNWCNKTTTITHPSVSVRVSAPTNTQVAVVMTQAPTIAIAHTHPFSSPTITPRAYVAVHIREPSGASKRVFRYVHPETS